MELIVTDNYEALSRAGADLIAGLISAQPDAAVVLPTGDTPMGIYRELAERAARGEVDASKLRVFLLDEYLGVTADDPRSLYGWLARSLFEPLRIPEGKVVRLPGDTRDPEAACRAYDRQVETVGGFDLAVLGLGRNGHLGFNEPPADPHAPTRAVDLSEESIESNGRYWGGEEVVPRQALTAGMVHLLGARHILLIVSGKHKREILQQTLNGPVTPNVPSSYLQSARNVTVIADRDAWPLQGEA
jgi:glucosamine-6-phosphate deaminase